MEFFLDGAELSLNSVNSENLKLTEAWIGPVYHMCLAGTMVASWSLTHEMSGLNLLL